MAKEAPRPLSTIPCFTPQIAETIISRMRIPALWVPQILGLVLGLPARLS